MSTAWQGCCPDCFWTPYDPEDDTCVNPDCRRHWSRLIPNPVAAEAERRAAADNLRRAR